MNLFHWINIAMLTVMFFAGWIDLSKPERKGVKGVSIYIAYALFVTIIIISSQWH